jgi:hypothetical protein
VVKCGADRFRRSAFPRVLPVYGDSSARRLTATGQRSACPRSDGVSTRAWRLPATWELVFGKGAKGLVARQDVWPLPNVYDGQRAAAKRMADLGIQVAVIAQVTGVRSS